MKKIKSYAARLAKKSLEKFEHESKDLGPHDVRLQVTHCGICHSDIHLIDNDWGISQYPLVPGHEIIGIVLELGSSVKNLKIGLRVGVGWQSGACFECRDCLRGNENLCSQARATCVGNHGGFGEQVQVDSRFAFPIPESLESSRAASLLCGGITVYAPLRIFDVKPWMRVGVIGMGGLGHLAVQYAKVFGCEVSVFSHTADKKSEALKLGAHHFILNDVAAEFKKHRGQYDFILSTVNVSLDWNAFVDCLNSDGKLCFVGIPPEPLTLEVGSLLAGRKSVCASPIGGRHLIQEMLEFSARHNIGAQTEIFEMSEVNAAITRVRENRVRYRAVLRVK